MYRKDKSVSILIQSKRYFYLCLPVTGENRKKRSESNDSDQSDEDHLPLKQEVTKKHKSFKPAPSYDKSIRYGKELANRKTYQKKGIPSECVSSLATKRKMTQKGKWSVLILISLFYAHQ